MKTKRVKKSEPLNTDFQQLGQYLKEPNPTISLRDIGTRPDNFEPRIFVPSSLFHDTVADALARERETRRQKQVSKCGSKESAEKRKKDKKRMLNRVRELETEHLMNGTPKRAINKQIAFKLNISTQYVGDLRKVLKLSTA